MRLNPDKVEHLLLTTRTSVSSKWDSTSSEGTGVSSWATSDPSFVLGGMSSRYDQECFCAALASTSVVVLSGEMESSHWIPEVNPWLIGSHPN